MGKYLRFAIPLVIFVAMAVFLWRGLYLKPSEVPSPLIGKPAPDFLLPQLDDPQKQFGKRDLLGKVTLLNVWASWCASCKVEHPILMDLSRAGLVQIYGLNYKDTREEANDVLTRAGNPYVVNAFDEFGKVGIDFGVYGVPETYVIDKKGIIRYKVIGPVTYENLQKDVLPLVKELQG